MGGLKSADISKEHQVDDLTALDKLAGRLAGNLRGGETD